MDDLTLLRSISEAQAGLDDERFEAIRARLVVEWMGAPAPARRSRRVRTLVLAGAAAVVLLVIGSVLGFGGVAHPESAVAETLEQAAIATIAVKDPRLVAGDYLHVRTDYIGTVSGSVENGPVYSWQIRGTNDEWVPADPDADWVSRRGVGVAFKWFSAAAKQFWEGPDGQIDDGPIVQRGKDGIFAPTATGSPDPWTPATLRALPTSTPDLMRALAHRVGTTTKDDDAMFEQLTEILDTGYAPARTRAAVYRAIITVPGIRITQRSANLAGRTGIAIGRTDATLGVRLDLVIDPSDGVVIGTRRVLTHTTRGIPAGTVESLTAVTTTVDHSAPNL